MDQPITSGASNGESNKNLEQFKETEEQSYVSNVGTALELIATTLLQQDRWEEARLVSRSTGQQLEDVLVEYGAVTAEQLDAAGKLHKLMIENGLSFAFAQEALLFVNCTGMDVEEALNCIGLHEVRSNPIKNHIQILFESGAISEESRLLLFQRSTDPAFSLTDFLVSECRWPYDIVNASLQSLSLVMQKKVSVQQAATIVFDVFSKGLSLLDALTKAGLDMELVSRCNLSLGELLTTSGIVTETDRAVLVEHALLENKRLGEVVVDHNLATSRVMEAALGLQKLALNGAIGKVEACQILNAISVETTGVLANLYAPFAHLG